MPAHDPHPASKPILGAREPVTIHGQTGTTEIAARIDTGAERSSLDRAVACEIGAGPLTDERTFRFGSGNTTTRLVAEVTITLRGNTHDLAVSIADRSTLATDIRLGKDVLTDYLIDITP
jgi:hypothetical protein